MLYFTQVNFVAPLSAYVSGFFFGVAKDSWIRSSSCNHPVRSYGALEQQKYYNTQFWYIFCEGELDGLDVVDLWESSKEDILYVSLCTYRPIDSGSGHIFGKTDWFLSSRSGKCFSLLCSLPS
jgi:hypothetical protein